MNKTTNLRAIILAAGMGTRLGHYTHNLPKGMLNVCGQSILAWIQKTLKACGINDIVIVTGHAKETVTFADVTYRHNEKYNQTNMVYSLMCAEDLLDREILISYADIMVNKEHVEKIIQSKADVAVLVDISWKDYWQARYGKIDFDTEGLKVYENKITEIGAPDPSLDDISARYIGLLKFSPRAIETMREVFHQNIKNWPENKKWRHSKNFANAYMTDMIQELIDRGLNVEAVPVNNGWVEFDTVEDYEKFNQWVQSGTVEKFYQFPH